MNEGDHWSFNHCRSSVTQLIASNEMNNQVHELNVISMISIKLLNKLTNTLYVGTGKVVLE